MKSLLESKTFWYAIVVGVAATIAALSSGYPEIAGLAVANTIAQVVLRLVTVSQVKL